MAERPVRLSLEYILPMPRLIPGDRRSPFEKAAGSTLPKLPKTPAERNAARCMMPEKRKYR